MQESILRRFHDQQEAIVSHAGISWVDGLKSWVVLSEDLARELLRSPDIVVYDRYSDMCAMSAAKGIRIDRLLEALQHLQEGAPVPRALSRVQRVDVQSGAHGARVLLGRVLGFARTVAAPSRCPQMSDIRFQMSV